MQFHYRGRRGRMIYWRFSGYVFKALRGIGGHRFGSSGVPQLVGSGWPDIMGPALCVPPIVRVPGVDAVPVLPRPMVPVFGCA
jgi:hypothetical protein